VLYQAELAALFRSPGRRYSSGTAARMISFYPEDGASGMQLSKCYCRRVRAEGACWAPGGSVYILSPLPGDCPASFRKIFHLPASVLADDRTIPPRRSVVNINSGAFQVMIVKQLAKQRPAR
jgi:hypothetical protein